MIKNINLNLIKGVLFIALISLLATWIASFSFFTNLAISPLIIGILLGIITGNLFRGSIPLEWGPGILFSAKKILRLAIILYGFKITFQQIAQVGLTGLTADIIMVATTFLLGAYVGIKFLKLDKETAFLTASGASICGAAAVLATEPVVKAETHKAAIAVATVVLFGTISMFLYPLLYKSGILQMDFKLFGIYVGSTVHEVAHVVGAGNAVSDITSDTAVIVKMTRVMLLVPLLILLSIYLSRKNGDTFNSKSIHIPWFAVGFVAVAGFNSFHLLASEMVAAIVSIDNFLLTMAMTALGVETNIKKMKATGGKPVVLGFILFLWLILGGYGITILVDKFTSVFN
ncbi:MAG: YeiH family putative sulfate export transporter [Bacteroidetes bacterium]|nr:YeiH family putative sulfate export transporter [Bacteroidota bacterium]HET6245016.1 YeiH family protein [Bacteroidia bacterium]